VNNNYDWQIAESTVTWNHQKASWGYHELLVWKQGEDWIYVVNWHTETAITTVGRGSEKYVELHDARNAAVRHLATILPKPQSRRLLSEQSDLLWEPWFKLRKKLPSR
jgi:hypothetical protein